MSFLPTPLPKRQRWGFLLTPWVVGLGCLVTFLMMKETPRGAYGWGAAVLIVWCLVLPTAYAAMFGLGWPALILLRRRGWFHGGPVLGVAVLIGAVALYLANVVLTGFQQWTWPGVEILWLKGASWGLLAGISFCLIAGVPWRRAPPSPSVAHTNA